MLIIPIIDISNCIVDIRNQQLWEMGKGVGLGMRLGWDGLEVGEGGLEAVGWGVSETEEDLPAI